MGSGITTCKIAENGDLDTAENEQLIEETLLIAPPALPVSVSQEIGLQDIFFMMQLLVVSLSGTVIYK